MKENTKNVIFASAVSACLVPAANAIPITQTINIGELLNTGGSFSGAFDISALLPGGSGPLSLSNGSVSGFAFSDAQSVQRQTSTGYYFDGSYVSTAQTGYAPGTHCYYSAWGGSSCYTYYYAYTYYVTQGHYRRDVTNHNDDLVNDSLALTLGDTTQTQEVGLQSSTATGFGPDIYETPTRSRRENNSAVTFAGDLNFYLGLDETALADLSDGLLSFNFNQLVGHSKIEWITLNVDVERLTVRAVSEPGTLGLLGVSLLGLAGLRARDRRKKQAK